MAALRGAPAAPGRGLPPLISAMTLPGWGAVADLDRRVGIQRRHAEQYCDDHRVTLRPVRHGCGGRDPGGPQCDDGGGEPEPAHAGGWRPAAGRAHRAGLFRHLRPPQESRTTGYSLTGGVSVVILNLAGPVSVPTFAGSPAATAASHYLPQARISALIFGVVVACYAVGRACCFFSRISPKNRPCQKPTLP